MSRYTFGGNASDYAVAAPSGNGGVLRALPSATGGTCWSARVGGTQYTDLIAVRGGVPVCTDPDGYLYQFQGPDGVTDLWVDLGTGTRFHLTSSDPLGSVFSAQFAGTATTRQKLSFDTAASWGAASPIPGVNELCVSTDTGEIRLGDGATHWASLPVLFASDYSPLARTLAAVAATQTSSGTLVASRHNPLDCTGGSYSFALPTGAAGGTSLSVERIDTATANTCTLTGSIRGVGSSLLTLLAPSSTTASHESLLLLADVSGSWWPIAGHKTKGWLDALYAPLAGATFTGSALFKSGIPWFDLTAFGGDPTGATASDTAWSALAAAVAAAGGGAVNINGTFTLSTQPAAFTVPVRIRGTHPALSGGKSSITFPAGVGGLQFATGAEMSEVSDLLLVGQATTAGSDHGVDVKAHGVRIRNVVARGFGGNGFNLDTSSTGNANNAYLDRCRAYSNKSHGFYFAGSNSNVITTMACDATSNGGWGFRSDVGCFMNVHIAPSATYNTAGGFYDNVTGCTYLGAYIEEGTPATGNTVTLGSSSLNGFWFSGKQSTTTFTIPNPSTNGWTITKAGANAFVKVAGTKQFDWSVDDYGSGYLALTNRTAGKRIMYIDGAAASGTTAIPWKFTGTFLQVPAQATGSRSGPSGGTGLHYFDTTQAFPMWSDGTNYRDAEGIITQLATKTANYTLADGDGVIVFNGTSLTAILPDPTTVVIGRRFRVKNTNASTLTVQSAGTSKTLDGAATQSLAQWAKASYVSDGTQWLTI